MAKFPELPRGVCSGEFARWLAPVTIAVFLSACGGGGGEGADPAQLASQSFSAGIPMRAAIACSDAHVYVTGSGVRALQRIDGMAQWVNVALAAPVRIDLANLGGGVLQALGASLLPAGQYEQVQLQLASNDNSPLANAVHLTGGDVAALDVPSAEQTGLKLIGNFVVPAGQVGDVVLSGFDPCAAVVAAGKPGAFTYVLKPVLQATVQLGVAVAPEVPFGAASITVMPLAGGGYVVLQQNGTSWTAQRYGADRQPVGPLASITLGGDLRAQLVPLAGGGYAAVWVTFIESHQLPNGNPASTYQAWAQVFTATGAPVGAPIAVAQVNPGAVSRQPSLPRIAALAGGGFVVVWGLQQAAGTDVFDPAVHAQLFNADGTPAGAGIVVAPEGTGVLEVIGTPAGGFIVTWGSLETTGGVRAFSSTGVPLGPVQAAGNNWAANGPLGVLAPLAGGGAVTVWSIPHQHLMMQQIGPDGTPLPAQVVDDATATPFVAFAAVVGLPDGGYVIAWVEGTSGVFARRYAADGTPVGPQTAVNTFTTNVSSPVGIALLADGGFMVTWVGTGTDGVPRTYSRTYPANG